MSSVACMLSHDRDSVEACQTAHLLDGRPKKGQVVDTVQTGAKYLSFGKKIQLALDLLSIL